MFLWTTDARNAGQSRPEANANIDSWASRLAVIHLGDFRGNAILLLRTLILPILAVISVLALSATSTTSAW